MYRRISFVFAAVVGASVAAYAQAPAAAPTANPISASHGKVYAMLSGVVVSAAEKMPEENYGFKPTADVRSFGQLVGHLADSQYYFCALASGDTKPASDAEQRKTKKDDVGAALKEAGAYCKNTYAARTDAKASE